MVNYKKKISEGFQFCTLLLKRSKESFAYTDGCRHNTVQYNIMTYRIARTITEHISDSGILKDTPNLTLTASYGMSFVGILEKIVRIITAPQCISGIR